MHEEAPPAEADRAPAPEPDEAAGDGREKETAPIDEDVTGEVNAAVPPGDERST
jgi:hypothetical protein